MKDIDSRTPLSVCALVFKAERGGAKASLNIFTETAKNVAKCP